MTTTPIRRETAAAALLLLLAVVLPASGSAQSDEAAAILPVAGTDSATIYSLRASGDKRSVERTGQRRLVAPDLAPSSFTDLKFLAGGLQLLTDFDDRGFATTDPDGTLGFAFGPPGGRPGVASASVAGYDSTDRPIRLLVAENSRQRIAIYDTRVDEFIWSRQLTEPPVPAELVQAIALPGHRVAVGMHWPSEQASAVDIFDLSADPESDEARTRYATKDLPGGPLEVVPETDFTQLRDIFGLDAETLLLTTRTKLLILSLKEEEITAEFALDDQPDLAGEFVSARRLPSGKIAAATAEPGLWTRPHANHRLFWLDAGLTEVLGQTPPLDQAPWRVEPARGHGGSGTDGFSPDLSFVPTGGLDFMRVGGVIEIRPDPVRSGSTSTISAQIANTSGLPIFLARTTIRARRGRCGETDGGEGRRLVEQTNLMVQSGGSLEVGGPFQVEPDTPAGAWCADVVFEGEDGSTATGDQKRNFQVLGPDSDAGGGTGNRVDPIDLDLRGGDAGPLDTEDGFPGQTDPGGGGGCGCRTGSAPPASTLGWLATGLLLLAGRRYSSRIFFHS